jgi:uncharacterized membrane protein YphA (DoxX/SURF4 family)
MERTNNRSSKRDRIIYWVATLWLALGMVSTGMVQVLKTKEETEMFTRLGYPFYLLTIIGVWKMLGVIAVLVPKFPLVKEWAYAGFFFVMSGAVISHLAVNDAPKELFGPILLIVLTVVSWYFRPADRKPVLINK